MPSKEVTNNDNAVYTTSNGAPVAQPYAAEKLGIHGPLLLQGPSVPLALTKPFKPPACSRHRHPLDFHHIDLLAHFDRERIPERVVGVIVL